MSESFMHLFPADPRQPKPDWPRLRAALLTCGFLRDARVRDLDYVVVHNLWERIVEDRGRAHQGAPDSVRGFDTLLDELKSIDIVPRSFALDCRGFGIPDFISAMKGHGYLSQEFTFPEQEGFSPGPLYWELSSMEEPSDAANWGMEIYFEDFGANIFVASGEGFFHPPGIPGTDRICPDWQELLDRWYRDPTQQWIDPETGKGYGILDLDWDHTLAAGRCWLEIHTPAYLDGERAAGLLTELSGQAFNYAHRRI
ncbi:MAG TPA: hypothetical protein VKB68_03135 [Stellaceae bacterium]|nr:hypothetical protein [Stellaceae bacterium]